MTAGAACRAASPAGAASARHELSARSASARAHSAFKRVRALCTGVREANRQAEDAYAAARSRVADDPGNPRLRMEEERACHAHYSSAAALDAGTALQSSMGVASGML